MSPLPGWDDAARAALDGRPADGVRRFATVTPPLLDALVGLASVLLAGLVWAGAVFREHVAGQPLDPLALLLRALAIGLTVRALLDLSALASRARLAASAGRHGLAVANAGFVYRAPGAPDVAVARGDLLGVRERGDWRERARIRAAPVYVLHRTEDGAACFAIPPVFEGGPGVVAEALMRLRPRPADDDGNGEHAAAEDQGSEDQGWAIAAGDALPSRIYDEAAGGHPRPGVVAIRHGAVWLAQGPQATMLLGLAMLDGFSRLSTASQVALGPLALGVGLFAAVLAPLGWAWLGWRHVRVRKGLSLVLSSLGLSLRTRAGVLLVPWSELLRARVESRRRWSLLGGARLARTLVIDRRDDDSIRYDEAFLGAPAELVLSLVEAFRRGELGRDEPGVVSSGC